jgi:hypothetical protein
VRIGKSIQEERKNVEKKEKLQKSINQSDYKVGRGVNEKEWQTNKSGRRQGGPNCCLLGALSDMVQIHAAIVILGLVMLYQMGACSTPSALPFSSRP